MKRTVEPETAPKGCDAHPAPCGRVARSGRPAAGAEAGAGRPARGEVSWVGLLFCFGGGATPGRNASWLLHPRLWRLIEWAQIRWAATVGVLTRVPAGEDLLAQLRLAHPAIEDGQPPGPLRRQAVGPLQLAKGLGEAAVPETSPGPCSRSLATGQRSGDPRGCVIGNGPTIN